MSPTVDPAPVESSVRWSDFVWLHEDDRRELVDGVLREVDVPTKWHERIVALLIFHLQSWVLPRKAGQVLGSGFKVRISDEHGAMPDIQLLAPKTWERCSEQALEDGHPELIVEVVSPNSRGFDRVTKLSWYATIGVPEYWIVDPEARTLECLRLIEGQYAIVWSAVGDVVFEPQSYPGLAIPLCELWEVARDD